MPRVREKSTGRMGAYDPVTGRFTPDEAVVPSAPPLTAETPPAGGAPDLIGRAKAAVTDPSEAGRLYPGGPRLGPQVLAPVGTAIRKAGEFLLPGSYEQLATQLILGGVPGTGVLPTVARVGGAAATGGAISAAKGRDPFMGAAEQGVTAMTGEALGGVARGALRLGQAAWSRTTENVGALIGRLVPAFQGKSAAETIRRVIGGEGQNALSKEYGQVVHKIISDAKDPLVRIPSLLELGRKGPTKQFPELMRASTALQHIQSLSRAGRPEQMGLIRAARQEFDEGLSAVIPPEARLAFADVVRRYARGKAIESWLGEGTTTVKRLLSKGRLNEPALEEAFLASRGELSRTFTPEEFRLLESVVGRGERAPLAITQPGGVRHIPIPVGTHGLPLPLPKAPIRVGRPEAIAEIGARGVRMLGQRGAQKLVEEE